MKASVALRPNHFGLRSRLCGGAAIQHAKTGKQGSPPIQASQNPQASSALRVFYANPPAIPTIGGIPIIIVPVHAHPSAAQFIGTGSE